MKNTINFILFIGIVYSIINYFLYFSIFVGVFSGIVFLMVKLTFLYLDNDKNAKKINEIFNSKDKDTYKLAGQIFKYNFVGRFILKLLLDKKSKEYISSSDTEYCLKLLEIKESLTSSVIKKAWKEQAQIFHPDKFQDENDKLRANERFTQITECKNKLLNYLKEQNV